MYSNNYENILNEMLSLAPVDVDVRQGSIYYDAVAAHAFMLAKYYVDLNSLLNIIYIDTATGEFLDKRASEYNIYRKEAVSCKRKGVFEGVLPNVGERFFVEGGAYYTIKQNVEYGLFIEAEQAGQDSNLKGQKLIPLNSIPGLISAKLGEVIEPGADAESDENLRARLKEKIANPAENGNKQHYKAWCESVSGIGKARIIPLWNGANTVKGVLVGSDGLPVSNELVKIVQNYIDPESKGLGEGVANLGAYFTAVSASPISINVSFTGVLEADVTVEQAKTEIEVALKEYLKELALASNENFVRIAAIGSLIESAWTVYDFSNLRVNNQAGNVNVDINSVAVLGTVIINV